MNATTTLGLMITSFVLAAGCGGDPNETSTSNGGTGGSGAGSSGTMQGGGPGNGGGPGSGGAGGTGSGGGPSFNGYSQASGNGNAQNGSSHVAMAPDGTLYVSWVTNGGDARVARSTDGGATFEPPVPVDDGAITPIISMARHPWIAADDDRVAMAFNDMDGVVYLYVADAADLDFGTPILLGTDVVTPFRDFPRPTIAADGDVVVAFHAYPASGARLFVARESTGYASEVATSGAPGVPCECCPLDIACDAGGDLMLAFRNNDQNTRDMWLAQAPGGGAFSAFAPLSSSEGFVPNCPMQGPRLAQTAASDHVAVWSRRGQDDPGAVMISLSNDGGQSWSGGSAIAGFMGDEPTVAVAESGRWFVTAVTGNGKSSMVYSDDGGQSWSTPEPLATPDGDLDTPQAQNGGGIAALSGVSNANVWLLRME